MNANVRQWREETAANARRMVVKVGSRVLVKGSGKPDTARIRELVDQLARLRRAGHEVILVSSGAIGAGMEALGLRKRPTSLPDLQMAAAVGQTRLMARYDQLFSRRRCRIGQVLLTHDGLKQRERHLNARNTLMNLLRNGIIPIVNENDAVAVEDIKFGDNDILASMVAVLVEADLLVLLTTVNGLREPGASGRTRRIPFLEYVRKKDLRMAEGKGHDISTGGMASKLQAAQTAVKAGIPVVIANGRTRGAVDRIAAGENTGTWIPGAVRKDKKMLSGRQRWIAFFHRAQGALIVDDGARKALETKGRSLLPIGIRAVEGSFPLGSMVNIKTADGTVIARGLAEYSSEDIRKIKGRCTADIAGILGARDYDEVVHRDNMVVLRTRTGEVT